MQAFLGFWMDPMMWDFFSGKCIVIFFSVKFCLEILSWGKCSQGGGGEKRLCDMFICGDLAANTSWTLHFMPASLLSYRAKETESYQYMMTCLLQFMMQHFLDSFLPWETEDENISHLYLVACSIEIPKKILPSAISAFTDLQKLLWPRPSQLDFECAGCILLCNHCGGIAQLWTCFSIDQPKYHRLPLGQDSKMVQVFLWNGHGKLKQERTSQIHLTCCMHFVKLAKYLPQV